MSILCECVPCDGDLLSGCMSDLLCNGDLSEYSGTSLRRAPPKKLSIVERVSFVYYTSHLGFSKCSL